MPASSFKQNRARLACHALTVLVLVLYGAACANPAVYIDEGGHACTAIRLGSPSGFVALIMGWLPPYTIPWLANVFLLLGLIALWWQKFSSATRLGGMAVVAGLTTWVFVPRLLAGYFLWQGALILFTVGTGILALIEIRAGVGSTKGISSL